jgi:hypothetical protein
MLSLAAGWLWGGRRLFKDKWQTAKRKVQTAKNERTQQKEKNL